ncbi:MAG: pyridoxal phosphate-dependent aminotransferase [Gemmatimonadales bacterium]
MTARISPHVAQLDTETAFEVLARARDLEAQGREILHLEIGEPDFPTPDHIVQAGIRALKAGATKYCPAAGLPELREAIAQSVHDRGLMASPENVLVTSGSKPMLFYAITALVRSGDEVLIPDPGFPIYESLVRFADALPVRYRVSAEAAQAIDPADIAARITPRTRVLVLNSPHNPTGAALDLSTAAALAELAIRHDLTVVSDEVYARLGYDCWRSSIATLPGMAERTVVVDGFSKTYAMTGWRLGYGVAPASLIRQLERFVINTTSCAPPFVQQAGIAALTGPQDCVLEMVMEYRVRRGLIVSGLDCLSGVSCSAPHGAFYAFPRISEWLEELDTTTELVASVLLDAFGLACLPGTAFGPGGAGHLRFSFATSRETIHRALEVLRLVSPSALEPAVRREG